MKRPEGFRFTAGQHIEFKVSSIDSVWHAFSLGSCPADDAVHLHIGVIGGQKDNWISPENQKEMQWEQKQPTWTFKLFKQIRNTVANGGDNYPAINAVVRGPYGSPFQSCYTRKYKACVLVGAGTGLTSALSVLKEVIVRRGRGDPTSDRVWFVWTCNTIRDLRWCWRTLQQTVVGACQSGAIDIPASWNAATSATLGWLGVSIFVSHADKKDLLTFLGYSTESQEVPDDEEDFDYHAVDFGLPPINEAAQHSGGGSARMVDDVASGAVGVGPAKSIRHDRVRAVAERELMHSKASDKAKSHKSHVDITHKSHGKAHAAFKLKMPAPRPFSRPSVDARGAEHFALDEESDDESDDVDLYCVVSTTVNPDHLAEAVHDAESMYVSSQQNDVLHSMPKDITSAYKRARTIHKGGSAGRAAASGDSAEAHLANLIHRVQTSKTNGPSRMSEVVLLQQVLQRSQGRQRLDIGAWLKEQVIASSLDAKGAHISDLFMSLIQLKDYTPPPPGVAPRGICVCYCGPDGLAQSLSTMCSTMDATFEYLAHAD
jgi:hypothetical protein